ncbi:oxidoreductase [Amycolatopsis albispora]|uniref:Oxidoreductase n=2 Tax=Amycolatopsis albispora TaxID=1804986 RepID=A0A344LKX4_9PSEU|nr:oxidoreductase [Amycolatopsis albispora]
MIGGVLARLAVDAGLDVVLSNSRGPETLDGLVAELGPRARAATPAEAAQSGDFVVATIPLSAYDRLPSTALVGKTVIDTMNYYPGRDGHITVLDNGELTSSALVQRHLSGSRVVKACNNLFFLSLLTAVRPAGAADRSALPIAGDDAGAKADVTELLDRIGYDVVDIGTLADSWRSEPGMPVYVLPYFPAQPPFAASPAELRRWFADNPGPGVPAAEVKALVAGAVRVPIADRLPT